MARSKKLTVGTLKNAHDKLFTQRKIILNINNNDYEVLIDEHIRPTVLDELMVELYEKYNYIQDNKINIDMTQYSYCLLLKYFTDIEDSKTSDFLKQIQVLTLLADLKVLDKIIEVLNQNELTELMPKAMETLKQKMISGEMAKYMKENPEMAIKLLGMDKLLNKQDNDNNIKSSCSMNEIKDKSADEISE